MIWMHPTDFAPVVAHRLQGIAPGRRVLFLYHAPQWVWGNPRDLMPKTGDQSPWLANGAVVGRRFANGLFRTISASGKAVDFFVTDDEVGLTNWSTTQSQRAAIAADPRFAPVARQFHLENISKINGLSHYDVLRRWNAATRSLINYYFHQAYFVPLKAYFPLAWMSDYDDELVRTRYANWCLDYNGWSHWEVRPLKGNVQSPALYGNVMQLGWKGRNDGTNPNFKKSSLPAMCWTITDLRGLRRSSDVPIIPWVASRHFLSAWSNSPYYDEIIRHIVLNTGQTNLLYFNPESPIARHDDDADLSFVLGDLAKHLNHDPHFTTITLDRIPYNSKTLVSGVLLANGSGLFRVTLSPGETSVTLKLPGDEKPTVVTPLPGDVGAWITRPAQN